MNISNKKTIPVLVIVLLLLSVWFYQNTITLFPSFIHAWTQSERYALSLGFLNNGFDFAHPCTYNLQTIDGITRVDFPINEYIVAIIMKISGSTSPAIFRIYTLFISITGLIYLYLLTKRITHSEIKSFVVVLFVFLSPIYVYYQAGFIPSVPAIAFVFIACYYYFKYSVNEGRKNIYLGILFFLLAALIRIPFIIFLFAAFLQQAYNAIKQKRISRNETIGFGSAFLIFLAYYFYNKHLGNVYGNNFLDEFRPARNWNDFKEIIERMCSGWGLHYFTFGQYVLLLASIIFAVLVIIRDKEIHKPARKYIFYLLLIFCGAGMYFLMMSAQYYDHDYYFLDSFFVPFVLLFLFTIKTVPLESIRQKALWSICFILLLISSTLSSKGIQQERYTTLDWDRAEVTRKNFIGTDKFLDSVGVAIDAKILVIDAYSTNVPLILMNRKGYTVYQTSRDNPMQLLNDSPWDYVAIQDEFLISDVLKYYPVISSMLERVTGTGKVSFYKRSKTVGNKSMKEFLNIGKESNLFSEKISFDSIVKTNSHFLEGYKITNLNSSSPPNASVLDRSVEYGVSLQFTGSEFANVYNLKVIVNMELFANKNIERIDLVAACTNSKGTVFYEKFSVKDYYTTTDKWQHAEFLFYLPAFKTKDDILKIYLWNPQKEFLLYDDLEVGVYR